MLGLELVFSLIRVESSITAQSVFFQPVFLLLKSEYGIRRFTELDTRSMIF